MKRIFIFMLTNIAVVAVLGIVTSLFGLNRFIGAGGLQVGTLMAYALVVGFTGAFISLLLSKPMAKWSTGARVIDAPQSPDEAWLVSTVQKLANKANIGMPEVAIYDGEANAFATGAFKNSSLVAVSTGLLQSMTRDEVEAVLAHEVAHIANGDMVTMTLVQGVMNTFVVFISRCVGYFVDKVVLKNQNDGPGMGYYITSIVMDIVLGFVAHMIVAWSSRKREFSADAGAAHLMGQGRSMQAALARLGGLSTGELPKSVAAMGIMGDLGKWFSTHPPIEERIAALGGSAHNIHNSASTDAHSVGQSKDQNQWGR
jgi:heat shock protein HtpX